MNPKQKDRFFNRWIRRAKKVLDESYSNWPFFRINCIMFALVSYSAFMFHIDAIWPAVILPLFFFNDFLNLKLYMFKHVEYGNEELIND
jgi:hypothetical protein